MIKKFFAMSLSLVMVLSMAGSAFAEEAVTEGAEASTEAVAETAAEVAEPGENGTPLVVAYSPFSAKFSPFYADTAYDQDAVSMTQISILTTDRAGGIIYNAIEGETVAYNGTDYLYTGPADISVAYDEESDTTKYTAKIRDDLYFSDGVQVTADDIIFTYYTYLDPTYVGSTTLSSYKIIGLNEYQTQTTSEVYEKYSTMVEDIFAAGADHEWSEEDAWTQEQQDSFWAGVKQGWMDDVQGIVNYVLANYMDYSEDYVGMTADEIQESESKQIAFGMAMWGFGTVEEGVLTTTDINGEEKVVDLAAEEVTLEDYYNATYAAYGGDVVAYAATESADGTDVAGNAKLAFVMEWGPKDEAMGGAGVPNIEGIKKIDDYTVEVTTEGYEAPAVYSILGIQITPMHYYGDESKYDYDNNMFGFDFQDLSKQKSLIEQPMGAGAYKFVSYENKVITFEANEYYFKGEPKIKEIQFKETAAAEVATAVSAGEVDAGEMTGSKTRFAEVGDINGNGEINGDVITTSKVDNLGYGYIGINADTVNVGGVADSEESKALRKALATVLAVYRDVAFDSYYGEAASVIQYPISNTSWAAPQATDEGYKLAFSVDPEGNDIYTADMEADAKYAAATEASLKWFEAAGYTVEDGKVTAAPDGGRTEFEVIIPGDGTGDHPSYTVLTMARDALEQIGITLTINDPADSNVLWDALDAGTQDLWCAAWGATIDPDMYQVYHSSGVVGEGGSDSNHYHIRDAQLDELIVEARKSDDQAYRKSLYKQCLDIIIDWAVEIPAYQRQNCIIFSTERINIDTLTPDITTFWGWMNDIELLEMN